VDTGDTRPTPLCVPKALVTRLHGVAVTVRGAVRRQRAARRHKTASAASRGFAPVRWASRWPMGRRAGRPRDIADEGRLGPVIPAVRWPAVIPDDVAVRARATPPRVYTGSATTRGRGSTLTHVRLTSGRPPDTRPAARRGNGGTLHSDVRRVVANRPGDPIFGARRVLPRETEPWTPPCRARPSRVSRTLLAGLIACWPPTRRLGAALATAPSL